MALIYVVEDDKNIQEIETIALKNSGYQVEVFGCAKDFWDEMEKQLPQLLLLDIMLPDTDGLSVLEGSALACGDETASDHYGDSQDDGN